MKRDLNLHHPARAVHGVDAAADWLLQARGLTVMAPVGGQQQSVLRDVHFQLARGKTLGLVGESGAGKSMLGRVIARHLPSGFAVSGGVLLFQGQDLLAMPTAQHTQLLGRKIAFIPQEPMTALNPVQRIGQQFGEHLQRIGVPAAQREAKMVAALAEVRLPDPLALLQQYPHQLSGGMCQRVMIAMAFASDPELVISDEATTALDVSTQAHIVALLRQMQARRGTSVIFVTHDMGLATHACDDVVVLYAGDVIEKAPAKQLFTHTQHPYTQALRLAIPALHGPQHTLQALPGQMPGVSSFSSLSGCRFLPRCSLATADCARELPALHSLDTAHWVRCLHPQIPALAGREAAAATHVPGRALGEHAILTLEGVGKDYAGAGLWGRRGRSVTALEQVDLRIAPGEFVAVVGGSGSGKSTLARMVMGLEAPTRGRITLNGQPLGMDWREWERRIASIQMIFQDPTSALNPRRKVGRLLTQAWDERAVLESERQRQALGLAADVGLAADATERFPNQLSGGQRQRVNIGRALCDVPQLLVADEIVSGLDVSVQAHILNLLLTLREQHKVALLLISHDLSVVRYLCSRVIVMHQGRIVEQGETAAVFADPQHPYTRALLADVPPTDPEAHWPCAASAHSSQTAKEFS